MKRDRKAKGVKGIERKGKGRKRKDGTGQERKE